MNPAKRARINRENARRSTGPISEAGKQKSAMNGFKHGLTGQRMILQDHEMESYRRLSEALHIDYRPKTEIEAQLVQKIIDCNMRLNRAAAIDCNLLNIAVAEDTGDAGDSIAAQTRAWIKQADSLEKLSRYEGRISRQMLQYIRELDRIQGLRKSQQVSEAAGKNADNTRVASLGQRASTPPVARVMSAVSAGETPRLTVVKPPAHEETSQAAAHIGANPRSSAAK
jgi:hypothetical protein